MFPQAVQEQTVACKCCGAEAPLWGVCDLAKSGQERQGTFLPMTGIPVYYHRCASCGFVFTTQFDEATREELSEHIYNDDYLKVDPEFTGARAGRMAQMLIQTFGRVREEISILDYGGGEGILGRHLQENGFTDVVTYDPFYGEGNEKPARQFNLVVAVEVAEHVPDPRGTFEAMASFMDADRGLMMFTTLLQPAGIERVKTNWWYIAPRNGHISIYSRRSLKTLLSELGLQMVSANQNLHFAYRQLPDFAKQFIREG